MEDLMTVASQEGKPQWGSRDPPSAGCYNSFPSGVPFFEEGHDSFLSDYGRFYLVCSRIILIIRIVMILEVLSTSG